MKKSIIKKLFIKFCKIMGYEIIDQNNFTSPTLDKKLNEDLSIINEKSIVLPLGEVKITRKVKSILFYLEQIVILKYGIKIKKDYLNYQKLNIL